MNKYISVAENKEYSEEQMRRIFNICEYNGYQGTFNDWIRMEIEKGYFKSIKNK